jgi:tRNA(adenine34) deaminase
LADHETYMRRAIEFARNNPKYPFGALIFDRDRGEIVAEGYNKAGQNPVLHGEIDAIHRCDEAHPSIDWTRLTLYTTGEPCAMCQGAIAWAGIATVVYGSSIPFLRTIYRQIDIRAEELAKRAAGVSLCTVVGGVLEDECNALFLAARALLEGS